MNVLLDQKYYVLIKVKDRAAKFTYPPLEKVFETKQ